MSKVFSNAIAIAAKEFDTNNIQSLIKLSELSRTICSKVSEPTTYLSLSVHSFTNLTIFKLPPDLHKDHYVHILRQIDDKNIKDNVQHLYQSLLTLSTLVLHNLLKKSDFVTLERIFHDMEETTNEIFKNHTCVRNLYELLRLPLIISPLHQNETSKKLLNYNQALENFRNSEAMQHSKDMRDKLSQMLVIVTNFYKSEGRVIWSKFSIDCQLEIFKSIYNTFELESHISSKCECGCSTVKSKFQSFTVCQIIIILLEISFSLCSQLEIDFHKEVLSLLSNFVDKLTHLKDKKCENIKSAWNLLGPGVYNLAVQLYKKSDTNALLYFYFFIQNSIKFEQTDDVSQSQIFSSSIQAVCGLNSEDYKKCLAFCALGIYLCPAKRDYFMSIWIKTKHGLKGKNNEIQTITLVQAFKEFSHELTCVLHVRNFIKKGDEIDLLSFELEQYKRKWKSKLVMIGVLKELVSKLGSAEKITKLIGNTFADSNLLFHESILETATTILTKVEENQTSSEKKSQSDLYLSILYFLKYKLCMKISIQKHSTEMEKSLNVVPIKSHDVDKDLNEEYDMVSTNQNFTMNKYLNNMKYLESSLNIIEDHFAIIIKFGDTFGIYHILLKISFEYILFCNKIETLRAVYLAFKIAQCENSPLNIIQSVSVLIVHSDIKKEYIKKIILMADKIVADIDINSSSKKTVLNYYIAKAKAFVYENPEESYKNYIIAWEKFVEEKSGDYFCDIKNQLLFLQLKYLSMPCNILQNVHTESLYKIVSQIPLSIQEFTNVTGKEK